MAKTLEQINGPWVRKTKGRYRKYNQLFPEGIAPWAIEAFSIQNGGHWISVEEGRQCGAGLFQHYRNFQTEVWPDLYHHRWTDLILEEILNNMITVILGPKSSGKTHCAARWGLTDYFCFPNETTVMASSTSVEALQARVFGELKMLFRTAKERIPELPGKLIDYRHAIVTDEKVGTGQVRDMRNAVIGVALRQGDTETGLQNYVGRKNKRLRLIGDECQFFSGGFLEAVSNLDSNPDFKGVLLGNPKDPLDALGRAGEPEGGWANHEEPEKTAVWPIRFVNSRAINLVGTDSPNFDNGAKKVNGQWPYPSLVHPDMIENVAKFWGRDSLQYYSQCKGVMKLGAHARRVVTISLCHSHKAFDAVTWSAKGRHRVYGLDLAYGGSGGDRCVGGMGSFGIDINGVQTLSVGQPEIIPVSVKSDRQPEDQIAEWLKAKLHELSIPAQDCFYDSTGRGSMGPAFARVFGHVTPVSVEFGAQPTDRPVRFDLYVYEKNGSKRLKTCKEHYRKFVSELWFSVRLAIVTGQIKDLPREVAAELEMREWCVVAGDKTEVESKDDTKDRMGRSPDLGDWAAVLLEGARRRGFQIRKLGGDVLVEGTGNKGLMELAKKVFDRIKAKQLNYSVR